MSLTQRRNALRHLKECQAAANKFLEAMNDPPVGGKIVTSFEKQIARLERDYFSLLQSVDPKDAKTMAVIKDLQTAIVKNQTIYQQGKEDPIVEKQKTLELLKSINKPENAPENLQTKLMVQSQLQKEVFGFSLEEQNKRVSLLREGAYKTAEKIEKLPKDSPERKIQEQLLEKAITQYGNEKAKLFISQLEVSGKANPGDRKPYIDKRLESLNSNPAFETDPLAKRLMEAECKVLPQINNDKFIENIKNAVRFDLLTPDQANFMNTPDEFKKYVEERLPKDKGYTIDVIPSGNNVLLKVSDGENTVVVKRGEVEGKLTDMGCDYKEALKSVDDKRGFAKVHDLIGIQSKAKGVNTTVYFETGEFVKGENMGSYFKKQPSGTETEILEKQAKALKQTTGIIDWLSVLKEKGVRFFDLKCGNFMMNEQGERINPDFKSLIKTGDHPDTAFSTSDIPVTFMTQDCIKQTQVDGKNKRHYNFDEITKTALAVQLMEMLTLSDDPGTSPCIKFGKIALNPDQPILEKGVGKDIFDLYTKLVSDPTFTLAEAKDQMAEIQKKIDLQLESKLQETTTLSQKEINDVSLKLDEVKVEMELTGKTPETEKKLEEVKIVLDKMPEPEESKTTEKISKFESILNKWKAIEKMDNVETKDEKKSTQKIDDFKEKIALMKSEEEEKNTSTLSNSKGTGAA